MKYKIQILYKGQLREFIEATFLGKNLTFDFVSKDKPQSTILFNSREADSLSEEIGKALSNPDVTFKVDGEEISKDIWAIAQKPVEE